jgi:protein-disulfide isomerase
MEELPGKAREEIGSPEEEANQPLAAPDVSEPSSSTLPSDREIQISDNSAAAVSIGPVLTILGFGGMLIIGMLIGFFGRPLLVPDQIERVEVLVTAEPDAAQALAEVEIESEAQSTVDESTAAAADSSPGEPTIMDLVLADARHIQGDPDAPITMVEFSDFKCPYCSRFAFESLSQIRSDYIDTGKVRFVYKSFPILGVESTRAAEAGECAAEQGKFWEFHDLVFQDQVNSHRTLDDQALINMADELDLDVDVFTDCYTSGRYAAKISQDVLSIQSLGVRGTPGFLVNGVYVAGAQPYQSFAQLFEQQLAAIERGEDPGMGVPQPPQPAPAGPRAPEGPPPPAEKGS